MKGPRSGYGFSVAMAIAVGVSGCTSDDRGDLDQAIAGPAPDYVVAAVTDPPASVATGQALQLTVTVQNIGTAAAVASSKTRYFLSADQVVGGDRAFGTQTDVPPLAIGASDAQMVTLTIPAGVPGGSYFVVTCADRRNTIPELDNRNNCTASAALFVDGPDLQVASVSDPPGTIFVGQSFNASAATANTGNLAAGASVTRFLLSLDTQPGADVKLGGQRTVPALAAGASSTASTRLTVDTTMVPGTYYLLACADDGKKVAEVAEGNNCTASAAQVSVSAPVCGDGVLTPTEQCEDGNVLDGDGCDSNCTVTRCGNGVITEGEVCDDGNNSSGDGCDYNCSPTGCGNGVITDGEECDDGNLDDLDGCDSNCVSTICGNGVISGGEECDDGNLDDGDGCDSNCTLTACGNGIPTEGEECDDQNAADGDGCDSNCTLTRCGNGVLTAPEQCDDGNNTSGDGCEADCTATTCGDGVVMDGEECDDGNDEDDDGCDSNCTPTACGNWIVTSGEECDDGDLVDNNGCDADCTPSAVVDVTAGYGQTCALLHSGSVRCWGFAFGGPFGAEVGVGYGNTDWVGDDETPAAAGNIDVGGAVIAIDAGRAHTCAVLATGALRCWGLGYFGQLGYGNTDNIGDDETPASAGDVDVGAPVAQVAGGLSHTCALTTDGAVRCWGDGSDGRLGYGNTVSIGDDESPASAGVVDVGGAAVQIVAGFAHTCALLASGVVRCWGLGFQGQLGYGNTDTIGDDESPASAGDVDLGGPVVQISAGDYHTCALLDGGALRCWGEGARGKLGHSNQVTIGDDETPAAAGDVPIGGAVVQVEAGLNHTCAVLVGGTVRCWGEGGALQLGYGSRDDIGDDETPAAAGDVDTGGPVSLVAAGGHYSCSLLTAGAVRCAGLGSGGSLGYASPDDVGVPAAGGDVQVLDADP